MTSDFYGPEDFGSSPFDDFLARIYGTGAQGRQVRRVDITRLMSGPARELLSAAASHAAERGGRDLDTEQLLWAAANMEPTRALLSRAGADPVAFRREVLSAFESVLAGDAAKVAVFTHGLPINVVLSHALGLDRITHFVPHYCSISRLSGDSLDRLSVVSVNETTFLDS